MKNQKILIIVFFFFSLCPFLAKALIISEVQIEGENTSECFIKLYNPKEEVVDVSGYKLRKKTSSGNDSSIRVFPKESSVAGKNYFIWASSKEKDYPEKINANVFSVQTLSKNNSIALFNNEGELIDAVGWGEGENPYSFGDLLENPIKGQTIKRKIENNIYQQTKNNLSDFYLYPLIENSLQIKKTKIEVKEGKKINPFFIAFFSSIILSIIILYFYKNVRT